MTRNWIAVNLVLLLIAAFLGWQLRISVYRFEAENDLARLQPVQDPKQKITQEGGLPPLSPPRRYNAGEFANIPGQNLFSETRTKEEKVEAPVVVEIPALQVKPVLVGVTISSSQRLASIIDPALAGATRKTQTKRVGDTYQGYTITDITQNQMVLESGTRREIIPLFDAAKHPVQAGKTPIQATRIVAFGGGPSAAGGVAAPVSAVVSRSASSPSPKIGGSMTPSPAGAQSGIARTAAQQQSGRQEPGNVQQPTIGERTNEQGQRVIRTPFGDVVRPPE